MKKFYFMALMLGFLQAGAAIHIVSVSNNQFSPANLNVVVGDVITWQWVEGYHNSRSLIVPTGAAAWVSTDLYLPGHSFSYTVTVPGSYVYECFYHTPGMAAGFTASQLVPVTLSTFNVGNQNGRPFLSWTTQQENNSDYFAVRRSYDGAIFTEIGRVAAAGHSPAAKNYSFIDLSVKPTVKYVYYELAIMDKDGTMQLTPISLFRNNENNKKLITSITPNPVSAAGHLLIQFNGETNGKMMVVVNDLTGRQVVKYELSAVTGVNNGHLHLGDLPAGNYVVQFSLNGIKETHKIRKK